MWSAACGQAAEDLEFLSHLPRRRREAPLELRVLARPLLEVRRARPRARLGLGLEGVLLAGVLRCFEVLRVCLWLLLDLRGDERVFMASGEPSPFVNALGDRAKRKLSESFGRSRGVTFGFFFVGRLRPAPQRERPFGSPGVCSGPPRRPAAASRRRVLGGSTLVCAGRALGSKT